MATILLTWELGSGFGHLVNLLPLARGLGQRGHRVFAALQDLTRAEQVLAGLGVDYLQAPLRERGDPDPIPLPRTFAQLLFNTGFGRLDRLRTLAAAWRNLLELASPELIVFDHSPTAMLAARGLPAKKALIGTGFFCPPDEYPMSDMRPWLPPEPTALRRDEDLALANANTLLAEWGQGPMQRLSQLFQPLDENFLTTFPELDHYQDRRGTLTPCPSPASGLGEQAVAHGLTPDGRGEHGVASRSSPGGQEEQALTPCPSPGGRGETKYWGAWPNVGGKWPHWPAIDGERVFAYLKPFRGLPRLLQQLVDLRHPTIVYAPGVDRRLAERFRATTLRFESELVDLGEIGRTCDLAIFNGNHGATVSMLLAGKPMLQVPISLEQGYLSRAAERLGAAVVASAERPLEVVSALMKILKSAPHVDAARQFAARYADYDPQRQIAAMVDRAEELLKCRR